MSVWHTAITLLAGLAAGITAIKLLLRNVAQLVRRVDALIEAVVEIVAGHPQLEADLSGLAATVEKNRQAAVREFEGLRAQLAEAIRRLDRIERKVGRGE